MINRLLPTDDDRIDLQTHRMNNASGWVSLNTETFSFGIEPVASASGKYGWVWRGATLTTPKPCRQLTSEGEPCGIHFSHDCPVVAPRLAPASTCTFGAGTLGAGTTATAAAGIAWEDVARVTSRGVKVAVVATAAPATVALAATTPDFGFDFEFEPVGFEFDFDFEFEFEFEFEWGRGSAARRLRLFGGGSSAGSRRLPAPFVAATFATFFGAVIVEGEATSTSTNEYVVRMCFMGTALMVCPSTNSMSATLGWLWTLTRLHGNHSPVGPWASISDTKCENVKKLGFVAAAAATAAGKTARDLVAEMAELCWLRTIGG